MSQLLRMRVELAWPRGGPGVNTFYFSGGIPSPLDWENIAEQATTEMGAVLTGYSGGMCNDVDWRISQDFDVIDVDSGGLVDQFTMTGDPVYGEGLDTMTKTSRATQIYTRLLTDKYENGKRLAGGTYFGPAGGTNITPEGLWSTGALATWQPLWASLTSGLGARLAVYHRPKKGFPSGGYYGDVINARVMPRPAVLRSRRD